MSDKRYRTEVKHSVLMEYWVLETVKKQLNDFWRNSEGKMIDNEPACAGRFFQAIRQNPNREVVF